MKLLGHNGVTSYGVIMYVNYIFLSIFFGYSIGSSPVVGYHYGAGNTDELKGLFKKSIRIILVSSVVLTLTAELLAAPLSKIFVYLFISFYLDNVNKTFCYSALL